MNKIRMNKIVVSGILGLVCIFDAQSFAAVLERHISIPMCSQAELNDGEDSVLKLKSMLENNELEKFYGNANTELQGLAAASELTKKQLTKELWVLYYIALAPMYPLNIDSGGGMYNDNDIVVKYSACSFLDSFSLEKKGEILGVQHDQLAHLYAEYYSIIMNRLRRSYDPLFKQKKNNNLNLAGKGKLNLKLENWRDGVNFFNHLGRLETRNNIIKFNIDSLEENFVSMLVRYFPNRAKEVRKYLKIAGYENRDANDLIDRSMGRNSTTEFLYKGRPKKRK